MSATFSPVNITNGAYRLVCDGDAINLSNSNARGVLAALGLSPAFEMDAPYQLEQFEAECETFLRIASGSEADEAVPTRVDGNMVWCGRRDGYLSDKVASLLAVARLGLACGATHMCVS